MFDIVAGTSAGAIKMRDFGKPCQGIEDMGRLSKKTCRILESTIYPHRLQQLHTKVRDGGMSIISGGANIMLEQAVVAIVFVLWLQEESARRYYSTKYFFANGTPNCIFSGFSISQPDSKFFDNNPLFPPTNLWLRYSNEPLRNSLEHMDQYGKKFIDFPLVD